MTWLFALLNKIVSLLQGQIPESIAALQTSVNAVQALLSEVLANQAKILDLEQSNNALLQQILAPPVATQFQMEVLPMPDKARSGRMKLDIHDDGQGFTATLEPVDSKGVGPAPMPTGAGVAVWTLSQEGAFVLAPSADGMSCIGTIPDPPVPATGVVLTATSTLADGVSTIKGDNSANPLNVVPGTATAFVVTVTAA